VKIDRRLFVNFDWILLVIVMAISGLGLLNLYSAGFNLASSRGEPLYIKQIYWILMGLMLMIAAFSIDYHIIIRHAYTIHAISLLLLFLVFFLGDITHGSQRWLVFYGFSFQPSELVKLTMIIALARFYKDNQIDEGYYLRNTLILLFIIMVPFMMIMQQPDLGTSLFLALLFFTLVFFMGIRRNIVISIAAVSSILAPLLWFIMKDYQRERILSFLNPERDPLGSGYHIIQSIIAIGSGGFFGKGYLKGTQTQLKFLPEQQTDFVFSVFAEEWGFLGVFVLMFIFLSLILWGFKIARNSRDLPGTLIAFGVTMFIFWEVFINIGMVLGLFPVVGIPLPFLSYGGSSMVILLIGIGLLMNISMRRFVLHP